MTIIKYIFCFIGLSILTFSCQDNHGPYENLDKTELSTLRLYKNSDRIAPKCSNVDALETDGKYSKELENYSGKIKVCNNQGIIVTLYTLKNGKHNGYFYTYDDSGLLIGKTYYENDKKNGDFIQLDESGRILIEAKYSKDSLVECVGPLCTQLNKFN